MRSAPSKRPVRIVEQRGGVVTVLTLGPIEAADQLRDAASIGGQ